tara:strand:+ start:295 stop:567 length:273 start_codon:yes stop_codon:yes gene_type:complete
MSVLKIPYLFTVGPFSDVAHSVEHFGSNVSFMLLFNKSVEQYQQIEKEYISASFAQNKEIMAQKELEMEVAQGTFQITANLLINEEELLS